MRVSAHDLVQRLGALWRFQFGNRWLLMILICGGQLCCLLAALKAFEGWLARDMLLERRREALETNREFAAQLSDTISRLKVEDLRLGGADWDRMQRVVERTKLPNEGFLCVLEGVNGRVICHPELRTNAVLMSFQLGAETLHDSGRDDASILAASAQQSPATGRVDMPDGPHLVAAFSLPDLNVVVLAHQRDRAIVQAIDDLNRSAGKAGVAFALLATIGTGGLTLLIVRRYENRLASLNKGLELLVERRSRALVRTRDAVIFGLSHLAESRHESTGEHLMRIGQYVECLARELAHANPALNERLIHTMVVASSLHDIGKVAIPDAVLLKPGRLTPRQRAVMREHTVIGGECIDAIKRRLGDDDFLSVAREIALSHHERWNGEGYPHGLKGETIPLPARIVAVADVYDALTSEREYKRALTHAEARSMIVRGSGKQFDPALVEAFVRVEDEFARIARESTTRNAARAAA